MHDKAFLDSNILIYLYTEDDDSKRSIAQLKLNENICVTSIQALNETSNVLGKKFFLNHTEVKALIDNIEAVCDEVLPINRKTIDNALELKDRYGFSFFDSLMLSSALEGGCNVIFSEDLSDGQVVEKTLKIVNPFK